MIDSYGNTGYSFLFYFIIEVWEGRVWVCVVMTGNIRLYHYLSFAPLGFDVCRHGV